MSQGSLRLLELRVRGWCRHEAAIVEQQAQSLQSRRTELAERQAFLPRLVVEKRPHRSVRRALLADAKCKWSISLAWRRGAYLSRAAQAWPAHARVR